MVGVSRDTTVVRIPLKSAKHHFGASVSRGSRPYNEDAYQAGVIELPAFAKRPPISLTRRRSGNETNGEGTSAQGASGDPQVFYFGVFDGHGGAECSGFLRERLHEYIENTATDFEMQSSLQRASGRKKEVTAEGCERDVAALKLGKEALESTQTTKKTDTRTEGEPRDGRPKGAREQSHPPYPGDPPLIQEANKNKMVVMEKKLVQNWKELVGGYFRRFKPAYFSLYGGYQAFGEGSESLKASGKDVGCGAAIEEIMTYAFLKADYDFVSAQAAKRDQNEDQTKAERPLNEEEILGKPHQHAREIGGPKRFKGGSTCTIAMVSTPSPTPFWNPATPSSMLVAHVGDTRAIICSTANGAGIPLTSDHHPSSPVESNRLRRYAATFVTDSFGEERISGLANTRAFGDIASKRLGVSAEPEINRVELGAAQYSFIVMVSDGVSGTLSDQEIVDIVKEAKTPEQAARDVVSFATEVSTEGDNATCLVVRLGGWERRQEGGTGSIGTRESRNWKREEASGPRNRRQ
jgi:protein phosphatase PTC6